LYAQGIPKAPCLQDFHKLITAKLRQSRPAVSIWSRLAAIAQLS
jgi:hypothetical protein